jgi:hypothetical protein
VTIRLCTAALSANLAWLGRASPTQAVGQLDPAFGNDNRTIVGSIEADSVQPRALEVRRRPHRPLRLYISRCLADGSPDQGFSPSNKHQSRRTLPANLIRQTEGRPVERALVQPNGKPIVFGGLRPVNGRDRRLPGRRLPTHDGLQPGCSPRRRRRARALLGRLSGYRVIAWSDNLACLPPR